jgi:hypothetical protein
MRPCCNTFLQIPKNKHELLIHENIYTFSPGFFLDAWPWGEKKHAASEKPDSILVSLLFFTVSTFPNNLNVQKAWRV